MTTKTQKIKWIGAAAFTSGVACLGDDAATERRRQSRRTPKALGGLGGRASTQLPTPLRNAESGSIRGDLGWRQEAEIEDRYRSLRSSAD
jgi:hypothetical protein